MKTLEKDKCIRLVRDLIKNYYNLLVQLDNPELTREVYDGLRLLLENKIPCTIGFSMSTYQGRSEEAQAIREEIYEIGKELCNPNNPFWELYEHQKKEKVNAYKQKFY